MTKQRDSRNSPELAHASHSLRPRLSRESISWSRFATVSLPAFSRSIISLVLAGSLFWALPHESLAEQLAARFDVTFVSIQIGTIALTARQREDQYFVVMKARSSGLGHVIRNFSISARTHGLNRNGTLRPRSFQEESNFGDTKRRQEIHYPRGIPVLIAREPPLDEDEEVAVVEGPGTVDPLTAVYLLLNDVPSEELCDLSVEIFGGKRLSRLSLGRLTRNTRTTLCQGTYTRIDGYSPDELEDGKTTPFEVRYMRSSVDPDLYEVRKVAWKNVALTRS